jgi:hypothetical protein
MRDALRWGRRAIGKRMAQEPTFNTTQGHLFVIHGKIESLIHDAVIVASDETFIREPGWRQKFVGDLPGEPDGWATKGWGRVRNTPRLGTKSEPERVWAVSVGGHVLADDYESILCRVDAALHDIRSELAGQKHVRGWDGALPLVALPAIAMGRGGHSDFRGTAIQQLVNRLHELARTLDLDIVLVAPNPAVYAAAQYARTELRPLLPSDLEVKAKELGDKAKRRELSLFLGAGVSAAAGLPKWEDLIKGLMDEVKLDVWDNSKEQLTPTDQAELIEKTRKDHFEESVVKIIESKATQPSLLHGLLASLDCRQVVTTNYDHLYEEAVAAATDYDVDRQLDTGLERVMPWDSAHGADRWILKLHGDVRKPRTIVLTRRHMVMYDAENRPSGSVLQALLLTKWLLMVGASMTDDNVIRLAHEVQAYREKNQEDNGENFGTVLDADGHEVRRRLWQDQFDWINLPGHGLEPGLRGIELFLDRVAFYARPESPWLLDWRFKALLKEGEDATLADEARAFYSRVKERFERGDKLWQPLLDRLKELGADYRQYSDDED